jgi:hypothetical protein
LFVHRLVNHTSTLLELISRLPQCQYFRTPGFGPSQCRAISSHHLSWTFSNESRDSTEKQSMMTWVSAYDKVLNRSNSSCPTSHSPSVRKRDLQCPIMKGWYVDYRHKYHGRLSSTSFFRGTTIFKDCRFICFWEESPCKDV